MNKNKGIIGLGLIVAIVLGIVVVGGGAYYLGKGSSDSSSYMPDKECGFNGEKCIDKDKNLQQVDQGQAVIEDKKETKKVDSTLSSEESSTESFNHQPGDIKSVKVGGVNNWIFAVDILSRNPNWLPGVDSSGPFFLNQNTKIRNLNITSNTKTYNCGEGPDNNSTSADVFVSTSDFIKKIQSDEYKTRYFDISGTNITAIYEQCLP